ncbi:MAG: UDP-N-acetylglucosamine 1-carboxyvinyltransferase [Thauera sp.]|nr:UDP-N-acetylglucosamine 1-carboxyvinyltransferase [Thauera sp.]
MNELIVSRSRLEGQVVLSGAKNSALKLLTASLLTSGKITLKNYPATLADAVIHVGMLEVLGKRCTITSGGVLEIEEVSPVTSELRWEDRSIRNTLLMLGALVTRTGEGAVPLPGGCKLGDRSFDLHEHVLRELGAEVWQEGDVLKAVAPNGRLKGKDIHLRIRSTGATENAILCGTLAEGVTRIWNPHIRPEILDLIAMLRTMGARIDVHGQERIDVTGVDGLYGATHSVIPDNMEAITWLVGAVMTGGDIEILDFPYRELEIPLIHLRESGARFFVGDDRLLVRGGRCYPLEISTGPYPGINSDVQPILAAYAACAHGESSIIDLRFPGRYGYADEMAKMGAKFEREGNVLRILGQGRALQGANVQALDLRAGIALALCGLTAEGETVISNAWQITRGYDNFVEKLQSLGGVVNVSRK